MVKNQITITIRSDDANRQWSECAAILRNIADQLDAAQSGGYSGSYVRASTEKSIGDWYITQPT